jgi:hypothetical protein
MDLDTLSKFIGPLVAIAALGWSVIQFRVGARKTEMIRLETEIEKIAADLAAHKEAGQASRIELAARLGHVETVLTQLPNKDAVHKLDLAITEIRGAINTQGETLRAVQATGSRVENFLLQAGSKT